jgi:hypothetical protein
MTEMRSAREHGRHVVLNEHDRKAALETAQQINEPRGLFRAGAGQRFVEQQELRLRRECHGKFERALFAVGQMRRKHMRPLGEVDIGERAQCGTQTCFVGGPAEESKSSSLTALVPQAQRSRWPKSSGRST